ncbi:hypothetical protein HPULCUR_011404 [Helicostylum pulchrum]|uniref:Uncharacterized protein n=1 Tax=Helicostylum pulchrum TaxID=562976 RepID=A0ABP9YFZ7_9FUNG
MIHSSSQQNKKRNIPRVELSLHTGNQKPSISSKIIHKHPHDNDDSSSSSSSDEDGAMSSFKKSIISHDDLMTEDDTDTEEEHLKMTHERNDVPNLLNVNGDKNKSNNSYEYDAYTSSHHDGNIYHPSSSIFKEKNDQNTKNQSDLFNNSEAGSFLPSGFSTSEGAYMQDNSTIYERATFNRRPSQLQHETTSLNALGPPSHVLKARRLSKNICTTSSAPTTPIKSLSSSSIRDKRKPSIVDNYSREFSNSNNSAVSPRFMALRKLSEVTTLPSHPVSYSSVPPVPQIPSSYNNVDYDNSAATSIDEGEDPNKNSTVSNSSEHENRVLSRIDDVIETQLQFHLGQVVWRASESHLEARRFWEEQKKEMFVFAATLVDRMESQIDMTRRMTLNSLTSASSGTQPEEIEEDMLRKELSVYKSKSQSQSFELEILKTRNSELEKQHEIDTISMSKQWEDKDATLKKLHQLEQQQQKNLGQSRTSTKKEVQVFNLETENKQLKSQVKQMKDVNRQLLEDSLAFEAILKSRDGEISQLKKQLSEAELQLMSHKRRMAPTISSTTTATGALDCSEDFGKKVSKSKKSETWADIMESEDEAKKSADEWAKKYRELQTSYFEVCMQLEKTKAEGMTPEEEKKMYSLNQSIIKKDEEIRHLKQAENVSRIQMDYMQAELNKYQRSTSPMSGDIQVMSSTKQQKTSYRSKRKSQHRKSTGSMVIKKVSQISSPTPSSPPLPAKNTATTTIATNDTTTAAAGITAATANISSTGTGKVSSTTISTTATTKAAAPASSTTTTTTTKAAYTSANTAAATNAVASTPKVAKAAAPSTKSDYKTEDGFLTFTTEINGQLSTYSIKLPNGYEQPNKRNTTLMREPMSKHNKLNPNAPTWKT